MPQRTMRMHTNTFVMGHRAGAEGCVLKHGKVVRGKHGMVGKSISETFSNLYQRKKLCVNKIMAEPSSAPTDATFERKPIGNVQSLPSTTNEIVDQAFESCQRAWEGGMKRQRVELLLPLIGATDLDDWPGGIRQQFKAAAPMVESLLRQLKQLPGLEGPLNVEILDDADAVGAWVGENLACILFPTPQTLKQIRSIAESKPNRLIILVNPQWNEQGNIVSDFGLFPWEKKANTEFVETFSWAYAAQSLRINGDYCKWLFTYPQGWQVSVLKGPTEAECILQSSDDRPSFKQVQDILYKLPWSMSSKPLLERIQAEAEFNSRTAQQGPPKADADKIN